jgi:peptidoglycan/LPS O-acetylase OafA/YrhL
MYFYLVYAIIIFAMLTVCRRGRAFPAAISYTILVAGGLWLARYNLSALLSWADHYVPDYVPIEPEFEFSFYRWLFYFSPYVRVFEFILGCLTAEAFLSVLHKKVSLTERLCGSLALVTALSYLVLCGLFYNGIFNLPATTEYVQFFALNFLCAPAIAVIMFCVARYDGIFARLMGARSLVALGETSYSIYLVHSWTLRLFERPAPPFTAYWAADTLWRMICAIFFTLIVSYASYRLIEVPARRWVRRGLGHGIALVLDRPWRRPWANKAAARTPPPGIHAHVRYTVAALVFLPVMALAGEAVRSDRLMDHLHRLTSGGQPEISVITATYGANCQGFHVPAPYSNSVAIGNATGPARQICNFRKICDLQVSVRRFADPANGCGKDFSVTYSCGLHETARSAFASAEALGKHVLLQCPAKSQP